MANRDEPDPRRAALARWLRGPLATSAFRLEPASEDASFRRYFRVSVGARTRIATDAPPPMVDCRPFVAVLGLLRAAGVRAPALHAADVEHGFLLLDDLGSRQYLDVIDADNADRLYADAFDALLAMQCRIDPARVPPYDADRLRYELRLFPQWLLARHLGVEPGEASSRVLEDVFDRLIEVCLAQPRVFVHRDYHSRNLMQLDEHGPGVLDFQDAVAGPVTYDLVSLLRDVYVSWPHDRVTAWVDDYHDRAAASGLIAADRARFRRWFDLAGVQRHLKIAGVFARLWHRDGKPRYLDDLPLTLRYLSEVAPRHPETEALAHLLEELDLMNRVRAARGGVPTEARRPRLA